MTALPAVGREGQWGQTTARQEGCIFVGVASGGWAHGSSGQDSHWVKSVLATEDSGVHMVTRELGL